MPFPKPVFIVDGCRTPFLKAEGRPGPFAAADLAVAAGRALLSRQPFADGEIDEVVIGCAAPSADEANIARVVALRLGCGNDVPAWTVQRNCASGMQALDSAATDIAMGRHDLVLAGGTEAMSRTPLIYSDAMTAWFARLNRKAGVGEKLKTIMSFRPHYLKPVISLLKGLTDPVVGLSMGQTAENVAHRFDITRDAMDRFALTSHQRTAAAFDQGRMTEVIDLFDDQGRVYDTDTGLRRDSAMEKLERLKPVFDREFGEVTAGNSAQVTDGAALLILASEKAVRDHGLKVLGVLKDSEWAALDPAFMGLGPVHSTTPLLQRQRLGLGDVNFWEINEAFAAQVLGCIAAWNDADYCRDQLGLPGPLGELSRDILNVDGGSISIGHPVGASGARIVLHLLSVLKRSNARYGIATICIGGGQGGTMLLERT